jgi:Family of unknown function (DUF6152)
VTNGPEGDIIPPVARQMTDLLGGPVKRKLVPFVLAVALLSMAGIASAHHGTSGYEAKVVTVEGTVTKYVWSNPHVIVFVDTPAEKGEVEHWVIELAAPLMMQRFGWSKDSMKEGDHLVAKVHQAKNGATVGISGTSNTLLGFTINGVELPHL